MTLWAILRTGGLKLMTGSASIGDRTTLFSLWNCHSIASLASISRSHVLYHRPNTTQANNSSDRDLRYQALLPHRNSHHSDAASN